MLKLPSTQSRAMTLAALAVALGKAAIAGAGVGLAALGVAVEGITSLFGDYVSQEQVLGLAAVAGGVLGMIAELAFRP